MPHGPRGYDPTQQAIGPVLWRALQTSLGAVTPKSGPKTIRKAFSTAWHMAGRAGPGRTPGGLITSPAVMSPSAAGVLCGDRPAIGPAGPRPGPARAAPTCEEKEGEDCRGPAKGNEMKKIR